MSMTFNSSRRFVMNKQFKALVIISLGMIVSSTSGFAFDRARDAQSAANTRYTEPYNARAEGRYVPSGEYSLTPMMRAEPFSAAEKRAFQAPTGHEVDGW
jgi:hypothetical protein